MKRTWDGLKAIMGPGAINPLAKELIYIAVSVTNNCHYCIASHTASAFGKGMTPEMFQELQSVIGMANQPTNSPPATKWLLMTASNRPSI